MFYRGFEIQVRNEHVGYEIVLRNRVVYTAATELRAHEWIDDCISATEMALMEWRS